MNENKRRVFDKFNTDIRITIPKDLFYNEDIKPVDVVVYELIDMLSYQKGYCWATTETFMASLNIGSNKTIIESIKKLEYYNFIKTEKILYNGRPRRLIWPVKNVLEQKLTKDRQRIKVEDMKFEYDERIMNYDWLNEE